MCIELILKGLDKIAVLHYRIPETKFNHNPMTDDVEMLDYTADLSLMDKSLYFNSFFLNAKGRKMFTRRVVADLFATKN